MKCESTIHAENLTFWKIHSLHKTCEIRPTNVWDVNVQIEFTQVRNRILVK